MEEKKIEVTGTFKQNTIYSVTNYVAIHSCFYLFSAFFVENFSMMSKQVIGKKCNFNIASFSVDFLLTIHSFHKVQIINLQLVGCMSIFMYDLSEGRYQNCCTMKRLIGRKKF